MFESLSIVYLTPLAFDPSTSSSQRNVITIDPPKLLLYRESNSSISLLTLYPLSASISKKVTLLLFILQFSYNALSSNSEVDSFISSSSVSTI